MFEAISSSLYYSTATQRVCSHTNTTRLNTKFIPRILEEVVKRNRVEERILEMRERE